MAADSPNRTDAEPGAGEEEAQWATEQAYRDEVVESQDVVVPVGGMKFRITQESPLGQAALVEKYGIQELDDTVASMPEQADLQRDPGQIDTDEADAVLRLIAYFRDILLPNVIKPDVCWAEPQSDAFDLSRLDEEDLMFLLDHITGKDADIIPEQDPEERKQERAERFR